MKLSCVSRPWTCPECLDTLLLSLTFEEKPGDGPNTILIAKIDDWDLRAHLAMHELCTCDYEPQEACNHDGTPVHMWTVRVADEDSPCPVHTET